MGKLYKRGAVWWYQHKGQRFSTGCRDKIAAEAESKNIERREADPNYRAAETRLDDMLDRYVQDQSSRNRSTATIRMHGYHVKNLTRILGQNVRLCQLAPPRGAQEIDRYLAQRSKENVARTTQGKELTTLRGALRIAARQGAFPWALDTIMPDRFTLEYVPGTRALTLEQVHALIAVLEPRRAAVVAFIVTTAADWQSVGLAEAEDKTAVAMLVRGSKNYRRWRTLPILEPFQALAEIAVPPFEGWSNVRRDLALACERAHVPKVTPRDLRRSHGNILRARGIEPHLIASMMGHADSRMVERVYGKLPADALAKLMHGRMGTQGDTP
jgi:integrase